MLSKIIFYIKQSWLLLTAALAFGTLLALTNIAWGPRIEANQKEKLEKLMRVIVTDAATFEEIAKGVEVGKEKADIYKALDADGNIVGWAFTAAGPGYDKIKLVAAVDAEVKTFKGYGVLECLETPGFGDKIKKDLFKSQFIGAPAEHLVFKETGTADAGQIDNEIVGITGATISSKGVIDIFNNYLETIRQVVHEEGGDK